MEYQVISHQHIFENDPAMFRQCHASTVCLCPNSEIAAAWFGGDHEKAPNVGIWFSRKVNEIWRKPVKVADGDGVPCWNPVLLALQDRLLLFYKVGNEIPDWQTMIRESEDFGETWGEARELVEGDFGGRGPVKNKCIILKNGTILAPASLEKGEWNCFVDRSCDGGRTWEKGAMVPIDRAGLSGNGIIQPTLWEDDENTVHMLARSSEGTVFGSYSTDGGRTWSEALKGNLPNNNSGLDVTRMEDGRLVVVYNPVSKNWGPRSPIAFSVSEDNGATWSEPQVLEHVPCDRNVEWAEFSYPAVVSEGDDIYLTYTWKRNSIAFWQIRLRGK